MDIDLTDEPRNLDFADGLDRWDLNADPDYAAVTETPSGAGPAAVLSAGVPRPAGSAALLQTIYADDYRGATVTFSGEIRVDPLTEEAGLRLEIFPHWWRVGRPREDHGLTVTGRRRWTRYEPDRFAGWLAGLTANVARGQHRRSGPVTLLPDWPEPLHPTSAGGLPAPEDLDRADTLRRAVTGLPAGQRRAVVLHYYADVPAGQVAEPPGAARAALHKARLRLRAYLTGHRPDLVPERLHMTTVRVARIESRIPPGPVPDRVPTHVIVLADDAGHRDLPVWLLGGDSHRFDPARSRRPPTS